MKQDAGNEPRFLLFAKEHAEKSEEELPEETNKQIAGVIVSWLLIIAVVLLAVVIGIHLASHHRTGLSSNASKFQM